jgi:hypothetical protein
MPGPEAKTERSCVKMAEDDGWFAAKIRFLDRMGCPDHLFAKEGRVLLVEFKAPGKVLEPHQQVMLWELQQAGIEVVVVDSVRQFKQEVLGWQAED